MSQARKAMRDADYKLVQELAVQIPDGDLNFQASRMLAAQAAEKADDKTAAIKFYTAAAKDLTTADGQDALFAVAELYLQLGQLSKAENAYQNVLKQVPNNGLTNERLAFLLSLTGRRSEATPALMKLVKSGNARFVELALASDVSRPAEQPDFVDHCKKLAPDDVLVQLATATALNDKNDPKARETLASLVKSHPGFMASWAMLGQQIANDHDDSAFVDWHAALPAAADDDGHIWLVRGQWARQKDNDKVAADCLWQAVIRMPTHRQAWYLLGQVLVVLNDPQADKVLKYSSQIIKLTEAVDGVIENQHNQAPYAKTATEALEKLGRIWEACAWAQETKTKFPQIAWPDDVFARHSASLTNDLPRIVPEAQPGSTKKPQPVPEFNQLFDQVAKSLQSKVETTVAATARVRFDETVSLPFVYQNGHDPATKGARSFEQTGGGVGIIDYDLDGRPDVFLPQGSIWKTGELQPAPDSKIHDTLFRNAAGGNPMDVSDHLIGQTTGFGQGCTVADFNNDGFPDLYVANIGQNRLFQNMGDGEFIDVTDEAELTPSTWTTSVMMADLNADGLPDIFDVNYLQGRGVYEAICGGLACSPENFDGVPDDVLINQGDGRFKLVEDATPKVDAKGLGIIAFDLEQSRRPSMFIANDQVANFFMINRPSNKSPHNLALSDESLVNGLAYNEDGLPMACMGIAADDVDGNGLTDLLVTNFHNEANTFYLQDSPGLFVDGTRSFGLHTASFKYVGWGTQFLDADLDGQSDLVIVNGHVDDHTDRGGEYQMRPQFFHNLGETFAELKPENVGSWFAKKQLGRGLARVDWNGDGLPEFISTNINAAASMLTNITETKNRFLKIQLHATGTARDAIGAKVQIKTGDKTIRKQLLAGDGYMASNERLIHVGLGTANSIDQIVVQWPSGQQTEINQALVNSKLIVVEGMPSATVFDDNGISSVTVNPGDAP